MSDPEQTGSDRSRLTRSVLDWIKQNPLYVGFAVGGSASLVVMLYV